MDNLDQDAVFRRAFNLAYFIHADKETALQIVSNAASKLQVAAAAQGKRIYYRPTSARSRTMQAGQNRYRNKIFYGELHLLQRLIYVESETYEKHSEQGLGPYHPNQEDLVIRFVKHLVRITIKRNSFYATLGLSRLLYNYSTPEAMEIYNTVIQDPERVKDDYYFRSRKAVLMQELTHRFDGLVKIIRGYRGEDRFRAHAHPAEHARSVEKSLTLFTPWDTSCVLPLGFNPAADEIPRLSGKGLPHEDETEVNRLHTILHPVCFQHLIAALKYSMPLERLEPPRFFFAEESDRPGGPRGDRDRPPDLDFDDLKKLKEDLAEQSSRRKSASAGLLRVIVDGEDRAIIDPGLCPRTQININESDELIEVRAIDRGKELSLATCFLSRGEYDDRLRSSTTSIVLEGGQKITFFISASLDEGGRAVAEVMFQETGFLKATSLLYQRLLNKLIGLRSPVAGETPTQGVSSRSIPASTLIVAALGLFLIIGIIGISRRRQLEPRTEPPVITWRQDDEIISQGTKPPLSTSENDGMSARPAVPANGVNSDSAQPDTRKLGGNNPVLLPTPRSNGPRGRLPNAKQLPRSPATQNPPARSSDTEGSDPLASEHTRSMPGGSPGRPLSGVKKVFLEIVGDSSLIQKVRQTLEEDIRASRRFTISETRDEADALLHISAARRRTGNRITRGHQFVISMRLIDPNGKMIWADRPKNSSGSGRRVESETDAISAILRDLLQDAQQR